VKNVKRQEVTSSIPAKRNILYVVFIFVQFGLYFLANGVLSTCIVEFARTLTHSRNDRDTIAACMGQTDGQTDRIADSASRLVWAYRERKCADTTGTVPVPWAGRFQC